MKITAILIALLNVTCAYARLGETEDQIAERYSKPIQVYRDVKGRTGHIHRSEGYIIMVQYIDGVSQSEVYAKEDDSAMTEAELNKILASNASGDKWQEIPAATLAKAGVLGTRMWTISRIRALSAYGPSVINQKEYQHAISVGTHAYNEQNKALDQH